MAGIQGMATPESVGTMAQVAPQAPPQAAQLPPEQMSAPAPQAQPQAAQPSSDGIDYDQLAKDALAGKYNNSKGEIDYDKMAQEALAPKQGFMSQVGDAVGSAIQTGMETIDRLGPAQMRNVEANALKMKDKSPSLMDSDQITGSNAPSSKDIVKKAGVPDVGIPLPYNLAGTPDNMQDFSVSPKPSTGDTLKGMMVTNALSAQDAAAFMNDIITGTTGANVANKVLGKVAGIAVKPAADMVSKLAPVSSIDSVAAPGKAMQEQMGAVSEAIDYLKQKGLDMPSFAASKDITDPNIKRAIGVVKSNPTYQDLMNSAADKIVDVYTNLLPKTMFKNNNLTPINEIETMAKTMGDSKGKLIGKMRDLTSEALGDKPIPLPNMQKAVDDLIGKVSSPDPMNKLYLDEGRVKDELMGTLNKLKETLFNSTNMAGSTLTSSAEVSYPEFRKLAEKIAERNNAAWDSDSPAKGAWAYLRKATSQDENPVVMSALQMSNHPLAVNVMNSKADFHTIQDAYDTIRPILKTDSHLSDVLVNKLIKNPDQFKAFSDVLSVDNPIYAQDLRAHAYKAVVNNNTILGSDQLPQGFDFKGFAKDINNLSSNVEGGRSSLDLISGSEENTKVLKAMSKAAEAFGNTYTGRITPDKGTLFGRILYFAEKAKTGNPKGLLSPVIDAMNYDKDLKSVLQTMDVNDIVKAWPKEQRDKALIYINKVMQK